MTKIDTEEKSPLLFVVDEDTPLRTRYFDGGRFNGIATGATAVFTHFPNYIGTCWIATAVSALIFFMMILLVLSTITAASLRLPRCVADDIPNNQTIHLVHIHNQHHEELETVKFVEHVINLYPTYNVRILVIQEEGERSNQETSQEKKNIIVVDPTRELDKEHVNITGLTSITSTPTSKRQKILKRRKGIEETQMLLNMLLRANVIDGIYPHNTPMPKGFTTTETSSKRLLDSIEKLIDLYPKISYDNVTYLQVFSDSPLYPQFHRMNEKLRIFSIRVLQLWQYGGISFDLETDTGYLNQLTSTEIGYSNFIINEKQIGGDEQVDMVNVDDKALYMESKVPCHAFFGQILMILRRATENTTPKDVMKKSIKSFCKHYVNNIEYCKKYVTA